MGKGASEQLGEARAAPVVPPAGELGACEGHHTHPAPLPVRPDSAGSAALPRAAAWAQPPEPTGLSQAKEGRLPPPQLLRRGWRPLGLGTVWPCQSNGLSERFARRAIFLPCLQDPHSSQSRLFQGHLVPVPTRIQRERPSFVLSWTHRASHAGQGSGPRAVWGEDAHGCGRSCHSLGQKLLCSTGQRDGGDRPSLLGRQGFPTHSLSCGEQ